MDGSVAAISIKHISEYLKESQIPVADKTETSQRKTEVLAERDDFTTRFRNHVTSSSGKYIFLEGAHGYGKTTFCRNFPTEHPEIVNLGSYCLLDTFERLSPDYLAQPNVFFDWLTTKIAALVADHQPRKANRRYSELVEETEQYLDMASKYLSKYEQIGLIFIDGLNEISEPSLQKKLLAIFPQKLPTNINIVLTAPNIANIEYNIRHLVKREDIFTLPPLSTSSCFKFCQRALNQTSRTNKLIYKICKKSNGHPLYLRYLIEYANRFTHDEDLDEFPILSGPIENYYETIWDKLLPDNISVNILSLVVRFRWGIPTSEFYKCLSETEQGALVSTMARIRHLFTYDEHTTIYHSSFSEFLKRKTLDIEAIIQKRIASFCVQEKENIDYCRLNLLFKTF